jgi:hypothetical protein
MQFRPASACRTVTITAAAAGVACLLAAGCGPTTSTGGRAAARSQSPLQSVTLAARQAARVNSFASTLSVQMSGSATGTMAGSLQVRKQPSPLVAANFSTLKTDGQSVPGGLREIATGTTLYLKAAPLQAELGKPWAAVPFAALQGRSGVDLGQIMQQVQNNNPMTDAQMMTGATDLRAVGTQAIDGVMTTHYTGAFPVSAGLAKLPPSLRATERKGLQSLGISAIGFNAWIDAQHQIRRLTLAERGTSLRLAVTMQVSGINQPISVGLPPASQVRTISASDLSG